MPLCVMIADVDAATRRLPPPARHRALSRRAREALQASAAKSALRLGALRKAASGRPLPSRGIRWSLSHKHRFVCAVAARLRVGIDVEEIRRHPPALFARVASPEEWKVIGAPSALTFARLFSAKEAVLKVEGVGIKGLRVCKVLRLGKGGALILGYRRRRWQVRQLQLRGHIFSLAQSRAGAISWFVVSGSGCRRLR